MSINAPSSGSIQLYCKSTAFTRNTPGIYFTAMKLSYFPTDGQSQTTTAGGGCIRTGYTVKSCKETGKIFRRNTPAGIRFGANGDNQAVDDAAPKDIQLYTAQIYAQHYGVSVDEASHRLELQDSFPGLQRALINDESETFGGLWIQHEPEYILVIAFTRDGEATLNKYQQYISVEVARYIEVRTAKKSRVELIKDEENLISSLRNQGLKVDSRIDIIGNCVSIDIAKADYDKFEAGKLNGELYIPGNLDINLVDSLSIPTTDIYGGLTLCLAGGSPESTSGFSVRDIWGNTGVVTCGHASDSLYYSSANLTFQSEAFWGCWDCQWHTTPGFTPTNEIQYWYDGSTLDITSVMDIYDQNVGDIISNYGRTSHYTAGQITSTSARPSYVPSASSTWIEVDNIFEYDTFIAGGDSGGPWFSGNSARGIQSGASPDYQQAYYMALEYLSILQVSIITS